MPLPTRFLRNDPAIDGFPNKDFCQRNQIQGQQSSKQSEGPFAPCSKIGRVRNLKPQIRSGPAAGPAARPESDSPADRGSESPLSTAILVSDTGQDNGLGCLLCHQQRQRRPQPAGRGCEPSELSLAFESHVHDTIIIFNPSDFHVVLAISS